MKEMIDGLLHWIINSDKYKDKKYKIFKLKFRMALKGFIATVFSRKPYKKPIECDVLIIHPSCKSYKQGRKKQLIAILKNEGLIVKEFIEKSDADKALNREFCKIKGVPFLFKSEAFHAFYILSKYDSKVILTERNGWIVPSFIKKIRNKGNLVVHIAHSIPTVQSSKYSYYDYDFYLVYGQSSYDYLNSLSCFFGSCKVLYKGPYFFYDSRKYILSTKNEKNITFFCSGPDYEKQTSYVDACHWIEKLVEERIVDNLYVKCHPRGSNSQWLELEEKYPSRVLFISNHELHDYLDRSLYAVMNYTNAIIDTAYYGMPVIMLGDSLDYFNAVGFNIPWVKSYKELVCVLNDSDISYNADFLSYHVASKVNPSLELVDFVVNLTDYGKSSFFDFSKKLPGDL